VIRSCLSCGSSSVPVDRRARSVKSDGFDAELLLRTLLAWLRGESSVCSMVPIPAEADEDSRCCVRERAGLFAERVILVNRIDSVLATLGVGRYNPLRIDRRQRLDELQTVLCHSLPMHARTKIVRMLDRLELLLIQIREFEKSRDAVLDEENAGKAASMIQQLTKLRGVGMQSATVLVREGLVREVANGKALRAYAGLKSTPYSGGH
jgi:transposase